MPHDQAPASMSPSVMMRGFTGHEMLDDTDLVQMNGRIYDPSLGKFLSSDTYVQSRYLAASLNRYSYVWSNSLSYMNPSCHFVETTGIWSTQLNMVPSMGIYLAIHETSQLGGLAPTIDTIN